MQDIPTKETTRQFKWVGTRPVRPDGVPKVTGRAQYGADLMWPGMLIGRILRSPHAHARIRSINIEKAKALPGVKAVVTSADFPEQPFAYVGPERVAQNFWHMTRNIMAREKVLYEGHAVAAVAAASTAIADQALALIEVDYEVLPHVIDVDEAMATDAPLLFDDMITRGDRSAADQAVEHLQAHRVQDRRHRRRLRGRRRDRRNVVQDRAGAPGLYRAAGLRRALRRRRPGRDVELEPGPLRGARLYRAAARHEYRRPRVYPAEIGGGFGGKTVVYVEPVATMLSRKSGAPVKMVMSREDVFKASGPTSGSSMTVKIGVKRDGRIVAADCVFKYQAGAFPGSPVMNACMCGLRALRHPERAHGRLRRGVQPAEGGGLSRAGLADRGLRGGERARCRSRRRSAWIRSSFA